MNLLINSCMAYLQQFIYNENLYRRLKQWETVINSALFMQ
jgi:hypothetical protein